ncbi:MAG TPA: hypothetical protein P5077_08005 [bacterium]|nr:hypothetical protein [bacterium]
MKMMKHLMMVLFSCYAFGLNAEEIRVVVLPKLTVENAVQNHSSLEAMVIKALQEKGMRVVELSAALSAQKAAFSDTVQQGKVPQELSVLNADALASVQLTCDKNSGSVLGSGVASYFCALNSKIIRIDTGDVVYTDSKDHTAHGMNALQAVQLLMKKTVGAEIATGVAEWQKNWAGDGAWGLDLVVTGLPDKQKAESLAGLLGKGDGITGASLKMFVKDFSKYTVSGTGAPALKALKGRIDADAALSLRVNYEAGRLIHAEFDFGRAFSRAARGYLTVNAAKAPRSFLDLLSGSGAQILDSYLRNCDYFEVKETVFSKKDRKAIVQEAAAAGVPIALIASIASNDNLWVTTIELVHAPSGRTLVTALGNDAEPFAAMDKAVRDLDAKYRKGLANPQLRKDLNFGGDAQKAATVTDRLTIERFEAGQIFPALLPSYRQNGIGTIVLKNLAGRKLTNIEVRYLIGEKVAGTYKLASLDAGKSEKIAVKLATIPESGEYGQIAATVQYQDGEIWGRKDAYAPLILHKKNAMNWAAPQTLASFIDPAHKTVRDLATKAIAGDRPNKLITRQLMNAALIFGALWHQPLKYVTDPVNTSFSADIDTVQFPAETLARLAGDCDDLTVLLASLYESVGLATVIITTPGHVLLGVESGILAGGNVIFNLPESLFVKVDGALFVPVEATAIGSPFPEAWFKAADILNKSRKDMQAFRTREAWKNYPVYTVDGGKTAFAPVKNDVAALNATLDKVRAAAAEKAPAWAQELNDALTAGRAPKLAPDATGKNGLAAANILWLAGDRDNAVARSGEQCAKDIVEACYNMTVMTMYDALDRNDLNIVQVNMEQQHFADAVAVLPANVVSMLLDNGGLGMGDEASKESEAKKKLAEVLKQARAKIQEKKAKGTLNIKTSHVGGRKGADASQTKATAGMLFWATVK